ncbi:MAG: hypothetical protein ACI4RF_06720, partial [Eubacterium sp.]
PTAGHMSQVLSSHAVLTALANKADKKTTLKGYGITDAYTQTEADALLADKANVTDVNNALAAKQDTLVYDDAPTAGHMSQVLSSHAVLTALANKVDKHTTLKGYGITDAYTQTEVDALLAEKAGMDAYENVVSLADISSAEQLNDYTDINKTYIFNLVPPFASDLGISTGAQCILNNYTNSQVLRVVRSNKVFLRSYSGTWSSFSDFTIPDSYIAKSKLSADLQNEIDNKYDASNVESGSGSFTYGEGVTLTDNTFRYQRVGKFVTVTAKVGVSESVAANSLILSGLPYINTVTDVYLKVLSTGYADKTLVIALNTGQIKAVTALSAGDTLAFTFTYQISA